MSVELLERELYETDAMWLAHGLEKRCELSNNNQIQMLDKVTESTKSTGERVKVLIQFAFKVLRLTAVHSQTSTILLQIHAWFELDTQC